MGLGWMTISVNFVDCSPSWTSYGSGWVFG
jgi:hypothetical protein